MTAMSNSFCQTLVHAGAPLGTLQYTARTLHRANGTGIEVSGCSRCVVSFMGLQTEFPIIICNLAAGTDAIIGTDVLGSVLPHTLDIKNGLLFAKGGASLELHRRDSALSGRVFTVGHCSIPPYSEAVLHCSVRTTGGRTLPSNGLLQGLTLFAENTGLIVGRTRPVEMEDSSPGVKFQPGDHRGSPIHRGENDYTGQRYTVRCGTPSTVTQYDRDTTTPPPAFGGTDIPGSGSHTETPPCHRLIGVFRYLSGAPLTGHTDAVEHDINTGDRPPIRCAPRRMPPQKMKKKE